MTHPALDLDSSHVVQETAVVAGRREGGFLCRADAGNLVAQRAVSCLVEPQDGDVVLLATEETGASTILAVLRRPEQGATRLVAEGDLELEAQGALSMSAKDGIRMLTRAGVRLLARELKVNAVDGQVALERLGFVGRHLQSQLERCKTFAASVDTITERLSLRADDVYRRISGTDHTRAQRVHVDAERSLNAHAGNAIVTAEELVKLDGSQIHVG